MYRIKWRGLVCEAGTNLTQMGSGTNWGRLFRTTLGFSPTDRLEVNLGHFRLPAGNGQDKTKGRYVDILSAIKKSIVVKAAFLCLAHTLITLIYKISLSVTSRNEMCQFLCKLRC